MPEPRRPDDPRHIMDDEWQRRRAEIEEAQRRGELYANMQTFNRNLDEIRSVVKDIQNTISQLSKEMVSRQDFNSLKIEVQGLSTWRWLIVGGGGVIVFLSQVIPKLLDMAKP